MYFEGFVDKQKKKRAHDSNIVTALIYGYRHRRPDLKLVSASIRGDKHKVDLVMLAPVLAESRARVAAARKAAETHGSNDSTSRS